MRDKITKFIEEFAAKEDEGGLIPHIWRRPLVGFGDANHKEMADLRQLVHPQHVLPREIVPGAKTVIAYFFPFAKEVGDSNKQERLSSSTWAMAYEKTNAALGSLAEKLIEFLAGEGYKAGVTPMAYQYDETILKSRWSQRHVARLCGLGTFGLNNMLITEAGTCGRLGTVVTDLEVEHDKVISEEYCLFKKDGSCGACVKRCPVQALTLEGYDRFRCNGLCDENAVIHVGYGCSYTLADSGAEVPGSNTCGKCLVGVPCTYCRP